MTDLLRKDAGAGLIARDAVPRTSRIAARAAPPACPYRLDVTTLAARLLPFLGVAPSR